MQTHYVPVFSRQALCGEYTDAAWHSTEPNCRECQRLMVEDDEAIAALQAWQPDPSLRVPHGAAPTADNELDFL